MITKNAVAAPLGTSRDCFEQGHTAGQSSRAGAARAAWRAHTPTATAHARSSRQAGPTAASTRCGAGRPTHPLFDRAERGRGEGSVRGGGGDLSTPAARDARPRQPPPNDARAGNPSRRPRAPSSAKDRAAAKTARHGILAHGWPTPRIKHTPSEPRGTGNGVTPRQPVLSPSKLPLLPPTP